MKKAPGSAGRGRAGIYREKRKTDPGMTGNKKDIGVIRNIENIKMPEVSESCSFTGIFCIFEKTCGFYVTNARTRLFYLQEKQFSHKIYHVEMY